MSSFGSAWHRWFASAGGSTLNDVELEGLLFRYQCRLERLPDALKERFVQLGRDRALSEYLERVRHARHGRIMTALHHALRAYLSDFDINGILGTYPMHVLGTEQWRFLLEPLLAQDQNGCLLDVGAGNGDVTSALSPLFARTLTTETSRAMAWRLRRRGFTCQHVDLAEASAEGGPFDAIACLNVLDRCDRPLTLLGNLRAQLKNRGLLIIALVLPYQPFVYAGATSRDPTERLALSADSWEASVGELCSRVLVPLGLTIESVSRVPYLSGGDARHPIYELDDVVVVCRAIGRALVVSV